VSIRTHFNLQIFISEINSGNKSLSWLESSLPTNRSLENIQLSAWTPLFPPKVTFGMTCCSIRTSLNLARKTNIKSGKE
jgi:hypothetical protein